MSIPIKYCAISKAASDDEMFAAMYPVMHRNLLGGHVTVIGCDCDPPCREVEPGKLQTMVDRWRKKPATDES